MSWDEIFPEIDKNNDPSWMILKRGGVFIEFNAGKDDPLDSLMRHIRGNENALGAIKNN